MGWGLGVWRREGGRGAPRLSVLPAIHSCCPPSYSDCHFVTFSRSFAKNANRSIRFSESWCCLMVSSSAPGAVEVSAAAAASSAGFDVATHTCASPSVCPLASIVSCVSNRESTTIMKRSRLSYSSFLRWALASLQNFPNSWRYLVMRRTSLAAVRR